MPFPNMPSQTVRVGKCRIALVTHERLDAQVDVPVVPQGLSVAKFLSTQFALIAAALMLNFNVSVVTVSIHKPLLTEIAFQAIVLFQAVLEKPLNDLKGFSTVVTLMLQKILVLVTFVICKADRSFG